jgi:hypothetical protein
MTTAPNINARVEAPGFIADASAFDTSGPVIVGIRADYSDNHKLFEMVNESAFQ